MIIILRTYNNKDIFTLFQSYCEDKKLICVIKCDIIEYLGTYLCGYIMTTILCIS